MSACTTILKTKKAAFTGVILSLWFAALPLSASELFPGDTATSTQPAANANGLSLRITPQLRIIPATPATTAPTTSDAPAAPVVVVEPTPPVAESTTLITSTKGPRRRKNRRVDLFAIETPESNKTQRPIPLDSFDSQKTLSPDNVVDADATLTTFASHTVPTTPPVEKPAFDPALRTVNIAILRDGPWGRHQAVIDEMSREIYSILKGEFNINITTDYQGDWYLSSVKKAVKDVFADKNIDLIISMGGVSTQQIIQRNTLNKPVIAPFVIDAELQQLPRKGGASGMKNLTYIDQVKSFSQEIAEFLRIVPFEHLAIAVGQMAFESVPALTQKLAQMSLATGLKISPIVVGNNIEDILVSIPDEADAILITPLLRFTDDDIKLLATGLIELRLPSLSLFGDTEVAQGLLTSVSPMKDVVRVSRRVALNVQEILLGTDAGKLDVNFPPNQKIVINMATARAIGVAPDWRIISEATLLHEEPKSAEQSWSLTSVIRSSASNNLELQQQRFKLAAEARKVSMAKADLLPGLELTSRAIRIDEHRAKTSLGNQAEVDWDISLQLKTWLYNEDIWTQYGVEKNRQQARELELQALQLDVITQTANAYLRVLRAKALERIRRKNLSFTQANLERAKIRERIGQTDRSDLHRWQSAIAADRHTVLNAQADVKIAQIELNKLLNRPLEEPFLVEEPPMDEPAPFIKKQGGELFSQIDDPISFQTFQRFMLALGLQNSPELKALNKAIAAQERAEEGARHKLFIPKIGLGATYNYNAARDGFGSESGVINAGSIPLPLVPGQPPVPVDIPPIDLNNKPKYNEWQIGISATLPLELPPFTSKRQLQRQRAEQEIYGLKIAKQRAINQVKQRILTALYQSSASYPNISLSQQAANAAEANLKIVTDGYARGVVSAINLLDAQNTALLARQSIVNNFYNFLADFIAVQRATGQFDYFMSEAKRQQFLQQWQTHLNTQRKPELLNTAPTNE